MDFKLPNELTINDLVEFDLYTKQSDTMVETPVDSKT